MPASPRTRATPCHGWRVRSTRRRRGGARAPARRPGSAGVASGEGSDLSSSLFKVQPQPQRPGELSGGRDRTTQALWSCPEADGIFMEDLEDFHRPQLAVRRAPAKDCALGQPDERRAERREHGDVVFFGVRLLRTNDPDASFTLATQIAISGPASELHEIEAFRRPDGEAIDLLAQKGAPGFARPAWLANACSSRASASDA